MIRFELYLFFDERTYFFDERIKTVLYCQFLSVKKHYHLRHLSVISSSIFFNPAPFAANSM